MVPTALGVVSPSRSDPAVSTTFGIELSPNSDASGTRALREWTVCHPIHPSIMFQNFPCLVMRAKLSTRGPLCGLHKADNHTSQAQHQAIASHPRAHHLCYRQSTWDPKQGHHAKDPGHGQQPCRDKREVWQQPSQTGRVAIRIL